MLDEIWLPFRKVVSGKSISIDGFSIEDSDFYATLDRPQAAAVNNAGRFVRHLFAPEEIEDEMPATCHTLLHSRWAWRKGSIAAAAPESLSFSWKIGKNFLERFV